MLLRLFASRTLMTLRSRSTTDHSPLGPPLQRSASNSPRRNPVPVAPRRHAWGAPMSKEPRVNLDRLVDQIVLDATLLSWFSYNGRRDDVMAAILLQRSRAKDTEDQALDFLVRHCGGVL